LAVLGCGFWADYQIAAWMELDDVEIVALYNRTISNADKLAHKYNIPRCYNDADALLKAEMIDFVDIITDVNTHAYFTKLASGYGIPIICQKPMASTLPAALSMLRTCQQRGVSLYIHENFRWQAPLRKVRELLLSGVIGKPFKARVSYCSAFPVFDNQPSLAEQEHFILADIGSHILDVCRFLFGEVDSLYCQTTTVNSRIRGEDVANVFMKMESKLQCYAEMSYASILENESFPQTHLLIEGENGSIRLTDNFEIKIVTLKGIQTLFEKPILYSWVDPLYAPVHSSIVDCNNNILDAIRGGKEAETTGEDNLKTVRLVWAAYESALENKIVYMHDFNHIKSVNLI
jgi:predicted dehydrogenase